MQTDAQKLAPTLDDDAWNDRLRALHKQLYASEAFEFDAVMTLAYRPPEGYVLADHCLVHDGKAWHLFYLTGPIEYADEWIAALRAGDFKRARETPYEQGDGHADGPSLFKLKHKGLILDQPQAEFGMALQGTSNIIRFQGEWINVYTARGPQGESLCLARSRDLFRWEFEPNNPIWRPPAYANPMGVCKNAHVIQHPADGRYLIYYNFAHCEGTSCVGLFSTTDFHHFTDHGTVFKMPHYLRGTQGLESPCVVLRNGVWHLFVGGGPGCWHSVSNRPDGFLGGGQHIQKVSVGGCYCLGPFHVVEVLEHRGRWWMTSSRKEYQRYLNRKAGVLNFRGTMADESALLAGLFVCEMQWQGDQPFLRKVTTHDEI